MNYLPTHYSGEGQQIAHLKVRVSGWGCPVTLSSKSSQKDPRVQLEKLTRRTWQASGERNPSSGLTEKHLPKVVSGQDSLKGASISPLFDTTTCPILVSIQVSANLHRHLHFGNLADTFLQTFLQFSRHFCLCPKREQYIADGTVRFVVSSTS